MKDDYPSIYRLVAEGCAGVTIHALAEDCYELSRQMHVPVSFIHNGREFNVELSITPRQAA